MTQRTPPGRLQWLRLAATACVLFAGARVWVLSTAYPFFNPTDEIHHYDAVQKYSQGRLPDGERPHLGRHTAHLILSHFSLEYLRKPEDYPRGRIPPPYFQRRFRDPSDAATETELAKITARTSTEFESPPAYYALAGAWSRVGAALGLEGLAHLYWTRWLQVPLAMALVAGAFLGIRRLHPGDPFLALGTAALLAVFPMDCFYGLSADPLSAVLGGAAFLAALRIWRAPVSPAFAACAGLAAALAFLTKYTNAVSLLLTGFVALHALRRHRREATGELASVAALVTAVVLPVAGWLGRNLVVLGSLTGTPHKVEALGWTPKSPAEIPDHPLFSPGVFLDFLERTAASFWDGELRWHDELLSHPALGMVYVALSAIALLGAGAFILGRRTSPELRRSLGAAWFLVVGSVLTLAALSLLFHFPERSDPNPSRPYFIHGRLIAGALLPFALCLVATLGSLRRVLSPRVVAIALTVALAALATADIWTQSAPFRSHHNGYHQLFGP